MAIECSSLKSSFYEFILKKKEIQKILIDDMIIIIVRGLVINDKIMMMIKRFLWLV